jgi:cytochrome c
VKLPDRTTALLIAAMTAWIPAAHAGDANHGARVFKEECAECHSASPGKNKKGPTLFAVVGRNAGSVPDFVYSEAMKNSGLTWTPDRLDAYIAAPRKQVRGGKMKYDGLDDASARADLIEYLNNTH